MDEARSAWSKIALPSEDAADAEAEDEAADDDDDDWNEDEV